MNVWLENLALIKTSERKPDTRICTICGDPITELQQFVELRDLRGLRHEECHKEQTEEKETYDRRFEEPIKVTYEQVLARVNKEKSELIRKVVVLKAHLQERDTKIKELEAKHERDVRELEEEGNKLRELFEAQQTCRQNDRRTRHGRHHGAWQKVQ